MARARYKVGDRARVIGTEGDDLDIYLGLEGWIVDTASEEHDFGFDVLLQLDSPPSGGVPNLLLFEREFEVVDELEA